MIHWFHRFLASAVAVVAFGSALALAAGNGTPYFGSTTTDSLILPSLNGTLVGTGGAVTTSGPPAFVYQTHAALIAAVTVAPSVSNSIAQLGFYAAGDSPTGIYGWNAFSYCPGGTSGSPTAADSIVCILPSGQSASTAGRYLLAMSGPLDPRVVGMQGTGADNIPYISALMAAVMPVPVASGGGYGVNFNVLLGQSLTPYYFSDALPISRGGTWSCSGHSGARSLSGAVLVFAAGVDGVRQEDNHTSPDGGTSFGGTITNCAVYSLGEGTVTSFTQGSGAITATMSVLPQGVPVGFPATTWNSNDGFIAWGHANSAFTISAGSVSGTTLTVTTMGSGTIFPTSGTASTSALTGTNVLPNTYITAQTGGTTGGVGTYTLNQAQPATVTATSFTGRNLWFVPIVPPGAYIDSASGGNLTIHAGFEPTHTDAVGGVIWQLPAIQAYTITTTSGAGSNVFTVTAGPSANPNRLLEPGDFVWSEAYPIGCVVYRIAGSGGAQTVTMIATTMTTTEPACDAIASAGSHRLWKIPSAHRVVPTVQVYNNYYRNFPIGINMISAPGSTGAPNATGSLFIGNTAEFGMIGFIDSGGNTGGSTWVQNFGNSNYLADHLDLGTVGTTFVGPLFESIENNATAPTGIQSNCSSTSQSLWVGGYFATTAPPQPACLPPNGLAFQQTLPINGNGGILLFPNAGNVSDLGRINVSGLYNFPSFAMAYTSGQPGVYFNTTNNPIYNMFLSRDGTTTHGIGWKYDATIDAWENTSNAGPTWSTSAAVLPGNVYTGYNGPTANAYEEFPQGLMIAGSGVVSNNERLIDAGTAAQTDAAAVVTASQAFLATSSLLAISSTTGVTAQYSIVDTTISASSAIGTIASSNSTQNWLTLTGASSIASSGAADSLLINGTTTITAKDVFGTTMTMIPVSTCTGVAATNTVTDTTQAGASVGTVSSCGPQATLVGKTAVNHASSGAADSLTIVQRRQGDFRFNLTPIAGGTGCWEVINYAGGVNPGCLIANDTLGSSYNIPAEISTGTKPTLTTGTCSASGAVGGSSSGTFVAPVCSAGTIILSGLPTAPHGWTCTAQDLTTPADALTPKSSTVTSFTFNPVTTVNLDVVQFQCTGI